VLSAEFGSAVFLAGICLFLVLLGLFALSFLVWTLARIPREWLETSGEILDARVEERREFGEPTEHGPRFRCRYTIGDRVYEGSLLRPIGDRWSNNLARAEEVLIRFPVGAIVRVFYKPADPGYAVLDRESSVGAVVGIVFAGLGSIVAGIWMFTSLRSYIEKGLGFVR
jgi:hypothetical protein